MDVFPVNWDSVPEVMNKEQFFRICHISKSTALHHPQKPLAYPDAE